MSDRPSSLDEPLLRRLFEDAVERSGAFGAQMSIIKAGEQVDFAAGFAHAARGVAMTPNTLIQIGSITKLFNAMIILSLVEDHVLDLDVPIKAYIPSFEVAGPKACPSLTLRHLLSMSSGVDNGPYIYFGSGEDALSRYVKGLKSLPQHFSPGGHFGYSNAGICIAGHAASMVTHKPWETLLWERILHPARLSRAAILDDDLQDQVVSVGHDESAAGGKPKIIEPLFAALRARAPSGPSFATSAGNLARLAKIFINKGVSDTGVRILSAASVELMMTPQIDVPTRKYGHAWCIGPVTGNWNGVQVWGHGGTSATSTSFLYWMPKVEGVIAFAVNTHAAMGEFSKAAFNDILKVAFGLSKPPIDLPERHLGSIDHRRYIGCYEELGVRMDVTPGDGDTLRAQWTPKPGENEMAVGRIEQSAILMPLGAERFLVIPSHGPDKHRGVVDMAFFGNDGCGRATNAINLLFPMSRVQN